jgi:hypothetical protein
LHHVRAHARAVPRRIVVACATNDMEDTGMDSSRRELSHTGDKRDTHTGMGAAANDRGQRHGDARDARQSASATPEKPRDPQRDDGRGRDARRNGSDSGR